MSNEDINRELGEITAELRNIKDILNSLAMDMKTDKAEIREFKADYAQFKGTSIGAAKLAGALALFLPLVVLFK